MDSEKQLTVKIPAELQPKLDSDDYVIRGSQVRDKLGKIVCNLESLEAPSHLNSPLRYFSVSNNIALFPLMQYLKN
jgi:hypothetical protein